MGPSTPGTAMFIGRRSVRKCSVRKSKFTKVYPTLIFIAHLNKSSSFWDGQQLLICHVIAAKKRGSVLPGFENKPFARNDRLNNEAHTQIEKFVNGPEDEDPAISKHYLVSTYGTNLRGIWAALATVTAYKYKAATPTTINPPTPSNQSGSPSKRPRRGGPAPKYSDSDSDEPTLTRKDSQGSSYAEQVRSKDLPPEDSVVLLIMRALNLIAYCTQQFGSQQPTIPILTLTNRAQAVKVALLATSWNKWHTLNSKSQAARKSENLKLKDEEISVYEYISHPPKAELKHSNRPLCIDDLQTSGGKWGRRQPLACRIIVSSTAHNEIKGFLGGPDPVLMHHSTEFLISEYGLLLGEIWAVLATVKNYPHPRVGSSKGGTPETKGGRRNTLAQMMSTSQLANFIKQSYNHSV
ncbi:uncharacterized protein FFB14_07389 [Fusarium fujikuroi]|nr:uncharacterized protein FFB14_07389 [Fusarium fujikuroi]